MNAIEQNLINDLKSNGEQSSWDWDADARFAKIIGDEKSEQIILAAIKSGAPSAIRFETVHQTGVPKKRLRYLRGLVKKGVATAYWEGLGEGGKNTFGVNRLRVYKAQPNKANQGDG